MVSFQCDGCSDVVKKPKLDQHHSRGCGASFTCIDCSKTFQTPADWKGHTSCISEAEKYQKALYKPKPTGGGREGYHQGASTGKFQGGGGQWIRPPTRWQATGANGTPLGTPTRMSPVTVSPPSEVEKNSAAVPTAANGTESKKEKPPKAHKKRKSEGPDVGAVETTTQGVLCPQDEPKSKGKKAKKDKKDKQKKPVVPDSMAIEANGAETEDISLLPSTVALDSAPGDKSKKEKKSKKDKKHKESAVAESTEGTPAEPSGQASMHERDLGADEKKKKKKHKSKTNITEAETNTSPIQDISALPPTEKKSKKRKREAEEETDVVKDMAGKGEVKKKKAAAS